MSDERRCTACGKPVDDLPYGYWLFHTCLSCAVEPAPKRFGTSHPYIGTGRKWLYYPHWHMVEHPARQPHPMAEGGA